MEVSAAVSAAVRAHLLEGRPDHLHQYGVREVAHDVLEDLAVGDEAEGAEEDDDGDRVADVRHR